MKQIYLVMLMEVFCTLHAYSKSFKYEYQEYEHSIAIDYGHQIVELEIVDQSIIHVTKHLKSHSEYKLADSVIVLVPQQIAWSLKEDTNQIVIRTPQIQLSIDAKGVIKFYNNKGEILLSESFTSKKKNTESHSVSQSFECGNEILYGLGENRNGIVNWKNVPMQLRSCHQEITLLLLISSYNYGICWRNCSGTDFNYPENQIIFSRALNKDENSRVAFYTPQMSGIYNFMVESENLEKNRSKGRINVIINSDTIIHYTSPRLAACLSGAKYLEAGKEYKFIFENSSPQAPGKLLFNKPDFNKIVFSSKQGFDVDYYFIHGESSVEIMCNYKKLTGKKPI